jgi:hypothetical protein
MATASDTRIPVGISDASGEAMVILVQWRGDVEEPGWKIAPEQQSVRAVAVVESSPTRSPSMTKPMLTYASKSQSVPTMLARRAEDLARPPPAQTRRPQAETCSGDRHGANGRIVETAVEARGARLGRPVLIVLAVSTLTVIVLFALIYSGSFG